MSNQSNNNRFNQNRDYSLYSASNTENNTTKDTFLKNGSNIIKNDYNNNFSSPNTRRDTEGVSPFVLDAKIKDLESKLSTLEETNQILLERINTNERNFQIQLKQLQVNNLEERENRYKAEKVINNISEQNNANSNDINIKLNMLQEALVKGDAEKMLQRQNDLESQKYLIGKLTEKITKTVKSEVEARYKADMDGKIFSQKINNKFENSLDILKKEIEEITNQTRAEMQNISRECSERTHNVSKYIDKQISEAIYGKGSANEELKNFVKKLTEQVKSGLTLISQKNEMIEHRMDTWEKKEKENKNDIIKLMNAMEQRLLKKAKDVKSFAEINIARHDKFLEKNISDITSRIEKNIQFLGGQLIDTRNKINQRFTKIFQDHHEQFRIICDDMQEISNRIYKYEDNLKKYETGYKEMIETINKFISDSYARSDIHIIQERILHSIECNFMQEEINKMSSDVKANGIAFNENLNDFMTETRDNVQQINDKIKEQQDSNIEFADKTLKMFDNVEMDKQAMEVHQIMNEIIAKVDNEMMVDSLQKSKNTEFKIMEKLDEHTTNIKDCMDKINTNGINISGLDTRVNSLEIKLDESQQRMSGMNQEMYKMKAESDELEIKESVAKVMESMLNYVESSITKDKMDKMGKFDLNSMRESIITLQEQITILSDTTVKMDSIQNDIQKLYEETNTLKNKPKSGDDIKLATIQMLNNVEFENIYSILNSGNLAVGQSVAENVNYSEMMENKINRVLEKIKDDNEKMWINVVQMKDKVTDPEEIKKILNQVHPAIVPSGDASKIIDEVEPYEDQTYMPKVNGFDLINKKNNENNFYGNYSNQQDPGPDINSKKSSKKTGSKKSNNSKVKPAENNTNKNDENNNNNNLMLNLNNEEKNSKTSKKSKTSKVEEEKKSGEKNSKTSKKSGMSKTGQEKNSKNSKNNTPPPQNENSKNSKNNTPPPQNENSKNSKNNTPPPQNENSKNSKNNTPPPQNENNEQNEENKSNKSKNENKPIEESQAKPTEENKDVKETPNEDDEDEGEEDEDSVEEGGDNKGTNGDLQGKLKKNEETSGKSLSGIKK